MKSSIPDSLRPQPSRFQPAEALHDPFPSSLPAQLQPEAFSPGVARKEAFQCADRTDYDVAIFGGGITGARLFHELSRRGHRVLLLDRGDFASGTSQASGMMIWGGLLYLKDLDLPTVMKLCRARDRLIEQMPETVCAQRVRYLPGKKALRNRHLVRAGMLLYWLLGSWKRRFPRSEAAFSELDLLAQERFHDSMTVEEAVLKTSDCRFALDWILSCHSEETPALNYCEVEHARFDTACANWRLELQDRLHGHQAAVTARFIVNAAGVWTDTLNSRLGIESPYRHQLSKGVYIAVSRPESLRQILVFDTGENHDLVTFVPWGPVAMFGPTETPVTNLDHGFRASPEDVRSLLHMANQNLRRRHGVEDIVSLRCGIRPLAVHRGHSGGAHPSAMSRKHLVHYDGNRRAVAVYGGKLTSCGVVAHEIADRLARRLQRGRPMPPRAMEAPPAASFPGSSEPVPAAQWCRDREQCHTLDDYLRRRTNIAQWVCRGGLGRDSENLHALHEIARVFCKDERAADEALAAYVRSVRERHDEVLAGV